MDLQTISRTETGATTLAMLKSNSRIRHSSEDDLLQDLLDEAEEQFEADTNRALLPTQYKLGLSRIIPTFQLPRPPFLSFASLKYTPYGGSEVTVDTSAYAVRYVEMLPTFTIPDLLEQAGSMEITWNAGWENADAVPKRAKRAIYMLATHWASSGRTAVHMDKRIMDVEKTTPLGYRHIVKKMQIKNADGGLNGGY